MLFHLHCMGQSCICPSASEITLKDINRKNLYQYTTMYNNSWMVCMHLHMNFSMAYCLHKMKPSIIMPNPYCVWTLNINLCEIQRENYMSAWASVLEICAIPPGRQLWRIRNDFSSILYLWIWDSRHENLQLFWLDFQHWWAVSHICPCPDTYMMMVWFCYCICDFPLVYYWEFFKNLFIALNLYMGRVTKLGLSCYLVLLSIDSKTR